MLRKPIILIFCIFLPFNMVFASEKIDHLEINSPSVVLANIPFTVTISAVDSYGNVISDFSDTLNCDGIWQKQDGSAIKLNQIGPFEHGKYVIENVVVSQLGNQNFQFQFNEIEKDQGFYVLPGILSILPPILAIFLALLLRQVVLSLFFGIWLGAIFINGYQPIIGFLRSLDQYVIGAIADPSHTPVIVFSLLLGGMVGIMSKCGGTAGIVQSLSKYAKNRRSGQVATWAMGIFIFFDDYANTLVVGNTMRPLTDKLRISREKLSYIVDSTAAPIASIAIISTWVGFQSGLIDDALKANGMEGVGYFIFFDSIGYSFYSIFTLFAVFLIGFTGRDFGSMLTAETRVTKTGAVLRDGAVPVTDTQEMEIGEDKDGIPLRWYNAIVPVLVMIVVSFAGLYYSGYQSLGVEAGSSNIIQIIGAADPFAALMWGTTVSVFVAGAMAMSQKILTMTETIDAWLTGMKAMLLAIVILILAWSIGAICKDLNTAGYIVQATKGLFTPHFLPALTFIIAAVIAFATGTSWATMAILTPLVVPLSHQMSIEAGLSADLTSTILVATVAAVLSGSVFGDHSSPISDTTIMSSMASGSDHIDHVRTQIPYALLAAFAGILFGYLPAGFGISPIILIPIGIIAIYFFLRFFGKVQSSEIN